MYLVLVLSFLVNGTPEMPQVLMQYDTLNECQVFLTQYSASQDEVNIETTAAGTVSAVNKHSGGEIWAVCAKNEM